MDRVELFGKVAKKQKGYKNTVDNSDEFVSGHSTSNIRNKCILLTAVYQIAIKKMGKDRTTWIPHCYQQAVKQVIHLASVI